MNHANFNIIEVNIENIENEHICCALGNTKEDKEREAQKKNWMKQRFKDGFIFKKFDVRGKVFIEYIPAENAWNPIISPGYVFVDCFWVSGKYKGQGFASKLLEEVEEDNENKNGLVILTSKKKMPFLADKKYLLNKGFTVCDAAPPYFELMVKKFKDAPDPKFKNSVQSATCPQKHGLVFYYTNHCTHTENWIKRIADYAESKGYKSQIVKINTKQEAQNAPSPFTTCSIFYNGKFLTHEIPLENKFDKLMENVK